MNYLLGFVNEQLSDDIYIEKKVIEFRDFILSII